MSTPSARRFPSVDAMGADSLEKQRVPGCLQVCSLWPRGFWSDNNITSVHSSFRKGSGLPSAPAGCYFSVKGCLVDDHQGAVVVYSSFSNMSLMDISVLAVMNT